MKLKLILLAILLGIASSVSASDQYRRHRYNQFKALSTNEESIVFVGNSITDMGNWPEAFGNDPHIVSRGVSGGFSYEVLSNVHNWIIGHPAKVFIKIGTNDLNGTTYGNVASVAANVEKTVAICLRESPKTKVYIQSIIPCNNGKRSDADIRATNALLKAMCDRYDNAEYVDLYSKMTAVKNGWPYGCNDCLHVTGAGYALWCKTIEDLVGIKTTYPASTTAASIQNNYGYGDSQGGRIANFSLEPIYANDIIFVGEGLVQSGEWNELLPGSHIKNHGTGWEVSQGNIGHVSAIIDATLKKNGSVVREMPRAIIIYAGSTAFDASSYEGLITKIHGYDANIKIYCVSLQPKASTYSAANNTSIKNICAKHDNVAYIDIATELNKHLNDAAYFSEGLPYYMSYVTIAQQIAKQAPELGLTAMTTLEAQRNYALATAAEVALYGGGEGISQYPADKYDTVRKALDALKSAKGDELEGAIKALNNALTALKTTLNGATQDNVKGRQFVLSTPNRSGFTAYTDGTGVNATFDNPGYAKYRWEFEMRNDGKFNIKNVATGTYMNPAVNHDTQITMVSKAPTTGFTIEYSDNYGLYIVRGGTNCQLNTTNKDGYPVYNWYGNSGNTNRSDYGCQWLIEDVTDIDIVPLPDAPDPEEFTATQTIIPANSSMLRSGSTEVTSGWFSVIKTKANPVITVSGGTVNNISASGDDFILAEGNATSYTYTVSVPTGFLISSMQADIKNYESNPTVNFAGKTISTTADAQNVKVDNIGKSSVTITMNSSTANAKALLSNWTVSVTTGNVNPNDPGIKYSKEGDVHWYYIVNASTKNYCKGKTMYYDAAADRMKFGEKVFRADRIWSFWEKDGKLAIKNYNDVWVGNPASTTQGGNSWVAKSKNGANHAYTISYYADNQFTIGDGKGNPLHAQESGSLIVRWQAEANGASLWNFEPVDTSHPEADLGFTIVQQGKVTTGIGNKNCPILRSTLGVCGLEGTITFEGFSGKVKNPENVKAVRAYFARNAQELYVDDEGLMPWREQNGELFGEATFEADGSYTIKGSKVLDPIDYYLWLAIDIADDAKEGATVDATITSYTVNGKTANEKSGDPALNAIIFLTESAALMPMDKGTLYYRIPAITTTADGKRLVILTDDRRSHGGDLPNHCYLVAQYSDDGGKTWSNPINVAGESKTGGEYGHGDASLITNRITGEITGIMTCSPNGNGYFGSTPDKPQTWKTITSKDGGLTWSVPKDHTTSLYAKGSPNSNWLGGFSGSGAGLQKRDGTLVSPFVNRESIDGNNKDVTQNTYLFMSKDGGKNWYVSGTRGTRPADEPKVLERNNGDLALSVRQGGYNLTNTTTDDGFTWKDGDGKRFTNGINGTACDGEYMYWCSKLDGNAQNIVFQTCPNNISVREKVSIALSTDEGKNFTTPKVICQRGSAYSAATVLPDGTLGVYYEENGLFGGYTMRFVRFSLDWASGGKYKFTDDKPFHPIQTYVDLTTPATGVNTIVLPFAAEVPEGMTAYDCTDEIITFTEGDTEYCGTMLQPVEGTLEGFHPYVYYAEPNSKFVFERPLDKWVAQPLPEGCEATAGPLKGWFVNDSFKGDGATLYTAPKADGDGVAFNLMSKTTNSVKAYTATYTHTFDGEAPTSIRILNQNPEGIDSPVSAPDAPLTIFDLAGRKVLAFPARGGVQIEGSRKVLR